MNTPLRYRATGQAGKPIVLLVHGWMMSGKVWNRLTPLLSDCRLIVPDLRGCGESETGTSTMTLDDHVRDLVSLCRDLDIFDCHLVGHSAGGQLAMLLADKAHDRFRTLTLMNPVPLDGLPLPDELQAIFRNCGERREQLGQILDMACTRLGKTDRENLLDDAESIPAEVIADWFDGWMRGLPGMSLDRIRLPTTVIATDDPFLPPDFLNTSIVKRLRNAKLKELRGPGHYPQVETPEATAGLLRETWTFVS